MRHTLSHRYIKNLLCKIETKEENQKKNGKLKRSFLSHNVIHRGENINLWTCSSTLCSSSSFDYALSTWVCLFAASNIITSIVLVIHWKLFKILSKGLTQKNYENVFYCNRTNANSLIHLYIMCIKYILLKP